MITILIILGCISFYVGGVLITAIIIKKKDGYVSAESDREICLCWPLVLSCIIIFSPIILLSKLIDYIDREL